MIIIGWFCFDNKQLNIWVCTFQNIPYIVPAVNLKSHNQTVSELFYPCEKACVISWTETLLFRFLTIKLVCLAPTILSNRTNLIIKLLKSAPTILTNSTNLIIELLKAAPTILTNSITTWLANTVALSRRLVSRQFYFHTWPDSQFLSYFVCIWRYPHPPPPTYPPSKWWKGNIRWWRYLYCSFGQRISLEPGGAQILWLLIKSHIYTSVRCNIAVRHLLCN